MAGKSGVALQQEELGYLFWQKDGRRLKKRPGVVKAAGVWYVISMD